VGALLDPSSKVATIDDVRRVHGPREGPAFAQIRRAAIVVSRDRLLTADEMAYWNYVAARQEDPNRSGMFDYDGQPSFEFTTGLRTDLATAIRPRDREPSTSAYVVDSPPLDPRECVGILFDAPVQTRFTVGQRVRLSGRVTATDRTDFDQILLRYWPRSGSGDAALRAQAEVSRSGMFSLELEFREAQKGLQRFEVFLFWPNASPQHPRCSLTTVTVDGTPGPASTAVATGR
jgi:hypothetical protein